MKAVYSYVWEFQVSPGQEAEFERHYGPKGAWAQLFSRSAGYLETLLLKDSLGSGRYITVDRWKDEDSFRIFRAAFLEDYEQLDQDCARFTTGERSLGTFTES